ncbi:unnamed protein product [Cochlearia groenlandica]
MLLLQQLEKQWSAMSRFSSNIDAHLRAPWLTQTQQNPIFQQRQHQIVSNQQQSMMRPLNHMELQSAYQDAWRVCHPVFKLPFSSLEDACERLLLYHVVADYEAEEEDRILGSDTTGQALSRSQQWDNNIAAKVAEFTATLEKQALAFNIITRKRTMGEFRSEERLMVEQALLQEERKALIKLKTDIDREKAGQEAHEAKLRMSALAQDGQAQQSHAEIMARNPLRANAVVNQVSHEMGSEQGRDLSPDEMIDGCGNNSQREEKEPLEDFLNDEENDNGETGKQENRREAGELDLISRRTWSDLLYLSWCKEIDQDLKLGVVAKYVEDVFGEVKPVLRSALDGHNICVLAYGQTGTGKTFTMVYSLTFIHSLSYCPGFQQPLASPEIYHPKLANFSFRTHTIPTTKDSDPC